MLGNLIANPAAVKQTARRGPFTDDHLDFLAEDLDAWQQGHGPAAIVVRDWWGDPPAPDIPLIVDFDSLDYAGIPHEQMEEHVRRDPLSVAFVFSPTGFPLSRFSAAEFRWPSDPVEQADCPSLPFPFFARVFDFDDDAPKQIAVDNVPGFCPTEQQVEWCCEILRTWERRGYLIWWWNWPSPKVGISAAQHTKLVRKGFQQMQQASDRCRFPNDAGEEITNATRFDDDPKNVDPMKLSQILETLNQRFGKWPRRVGDILFVLDADGQPRFLTTKDALFSWYSLFGQLNWRSGRGFVSQSQFFEALRASAKQYAAIESLPHEPLLPDRFYLTTAPEPGDGLALQALLARFSAETEHDRQLIAAMFATIVWGESGGRRPAFLLTADGGRGAGKSALAKMVAAFAGGEFCISPSEDEGRIKNRLLTPSSLTKRVALIDNIKSMKFSWDFLESLITSESISGHRLHSGEASRPNNLTWLLTCNAAGLSADMAQRVITIKLDRPKYSGHWEEETLGFIRENRQQLIADLIAVLRRDKQPLTKYSRWGRWESEILCRLNEPNELQRLILDRQHGTDAEAEEAGMIEEYFCQTLADLGLDAVAGRLFIPFEIAFQWYRGATAESGLNKNAVSRRLNQAITEGRIKHLVPNRLNSAKGRGYQWNGKGAMGDVDYASVEHAIEQRRIMERGM